MLISLLLLGLESIDFIDLPEDVLALVRVDQTELHEVDLAVLVVVEHVEYQSIVLYWKLDAGELAAGDELLEAQSTVEVLVDAPEGAPIVAELLLNPNVDLLQQLLDVVSLLRRVRLHHELRLVLLGLVLLRFLGVGLVLLAVHVRERVHRDCILEVVRIVVEVRCQHGAVVVDPLQRLQLLEAETVLRVEAFLARDLLGEVDRWRVVVEHVFDIQHVQEEVKDETRVSQASLLDALE